MCYEDQLEIENMMEIVELKSTEELEQAFTVLKELRQKLNFRDYLDIYKKASEKDCFCLVGVFEGKNCLAVMGYRILYDFVHGKHLYIDDLIVTDKCRSQGMGAHLLNHAEKIAQENQCRGLRLCTGIDNHRGKKFYERNNWIAKSIAFKRPI